MPLPGPHVSILTQITKSHETPYGRNGSGRQHKALYINVLLVRIDDIEDARNSETKQQQRHAFRSKNDV